MKKTNIILILLLSFSYILKAQDSLSNVLKDAKEKYADEHYVASMKAYKKAFEIDENNYEAAMGYADSQHKLDSFKQAVAVYDKAEEIRNDDAKLYFNRGAAKVFLEDYRQAIKDFDKSIDLQPDFAEVYYYKGFSNASLDRYHNAIKSYNKAIELKPDYAEAIYNRGAAKAELGNYEDGMDDFEKALDKDADLKNGRINLALSQLGMKKYDKAVRMLTEIIGNRDDNLARAYFYRGEAEYELKDKDEACSDWSKAANLGHEQAKKNANTFCDQESKKKKRDIEIIF